MTFQTDPTAMRPASAARHRSQPGVGSVAGAWLLNASLLKWPSLVWLLGSTPWAALWLLAPSATAVSTAAMSVSFLTIGAICYASTVASLLPIRGLAAGPTDALPAGLLAAIGIRAGTALTFVLGAIAAGWLERDSVALPIVLWYMAFLVTDLIVVNRFLSDALPISVGRHSERTTC